MATSKANEQVVEIRPIKLEKVVLHIVGDSSLIEHAWSEKAKRMMLEAQMGMAKGKKKEVRNPVEDFINSLYWLTPKPEKMTEEGYETAIANGAKFGFPVTAFKQAAISAAYRMGWSKDKVSLRGAFFIEPDITTADGDMIEIHADAPEMREDMVRIGMGTADIRFRGQLNNWSCDLKVSYNANGQYSLENIVNIINAGGLICGVGEWRPEKDGQNGMFHVAT